MNLTTPRTLLVSLFLLFGAHLLQAQPVKPEKTAATTQTSFPETASTAHYTYKIIVAEAGTFGFEIQQNGRAFIRQTTIPGQPGNKGFTKKADATKIADLMITKLKRGEMPPSITKKELQELKVIN